MKREPWAIANAFAYGVRVLNSIFCTDCKNEPEYGEDDLWLVVEQINSMCSVIMIDDAYDILVMVQSIPMNRLCERTDCNYHHPEDPTKHNYCNFQDKCDECIHNKKSKEEKSNQMEHFEDTE